MPTTLKDYTVAPAPTFGLPTDAERRSLRVGQFAKVVFVVGVDRSDPRPQPEGERMWVRVTHVLGDGRYKGKLDNDPLYARIKCGAVVRFAWNNVISILEEQ